MNRLDALLSLVSDQPSASSVFPFGGSVAVRTVTHYYTGRVHGVHGNFLILEDAAWIPDTGRWSTFLSAGTANEIEPYPENVAIALGAIIDATPWPHTLPSAVK